MLLPSTVESAAPPPVRLAMRFFDMYQSFQETCYMTQDINT